MLKESLFQLDSVDDKPSILVGFTSGQTWNGFACPLATKSEIEKFMLTDSYASEWFFDGEDLIMPNDGYCDEPFVVGIKEVDGKELYNLGFFLCWFEVNDLGLDTSLIIDWLNNLGFYAMKLNDGRFAKGVEGISLESVPSKGGVGSWGWTIERDLPRWISRGYDMNFDLVGGIPTIKITEKENE